MVKEPLFSIVTITYNSALYVQNTLTGVLGQTYTDFEYIIGDDCSTDNTWDIVNTYNDSRIVKYRNEKNIGEYPNRNKAIALAKGQYLIFIDGDDVMYPQALEYYLYYIAKFPEAALFIQKNYANNFLFPVKLSPKQSFCNTYFGKIHLTSSSFAANVFKTNVLKKEGGLSLDYISGDEEIRLKLAFQYPIVLIAGWVTWPRETPNSASSKINMRILLTEGTKMLRDFIAKKTLSSEITTVMSEEALKAKRKKEAQLLIAFAKKGKLSLAKDVVKASNIGLHNILKILRFKPSFSDEFDRYTASNPYDNDFNSICGVQRK